MAELKPVHRTALGAAALRALHLLDDGEPKIYADELALQLLGDDGEAMLKMCRDSGASSAAWVLRSRYAEDRLAAAVTRGVGQYVLLGAGLDTYAYRAASRAAGVAVFEVDAPDLQAWKRARLVELGIDTSGCRFVPCDFETTDAGTELAVAGFDAASPCFVSWLGVTQYLSTRAIEETLRWIARQASGSEIVMTYCPPEAASQPIVAATKARGSPFDTFFDRNQIEALLTSAGLKVGEHPTVEEMNSRYFDRRTDALRAPTMETTLAALVL